ncbi:MAG: biotin transporter BioY [Lachnospiraceae bacterium]|nr:biotin transporter BioY [Lachnospiraceae bacterium]
MKSNTKNLVLCAICAALICVLAPVSIPMPGGVPISLATFAVMLAGLLLGAGYGTVSALIYLVLGAVGVPVFAGWTAGIGKLAGPTGGYLVGYLALTSVIGAIYFSFGRNKKGSMKIVLMAAAMIAGTVVLYVFGTAWFVIATHTPLVTALGYCVLPFLIGDAIKMIVLMIIVPAIEHALLKTGNIEISTADNNVQAAK